MRGKVQVEKEFMELFNSLIQEGYMPHEVAYVISRSYAANVLANYIRNHNEV